MPAATFARDYRTPEAGTAWYAFASFCLHMAVLVLLIVLGRGTMPGGDSSLATVSFIGEYAPAAEAVSEPLAPFTLNNIVPPAPEEVIAENPPTEETPPLAQQEAEAPEPEPAQAAAGTPPPQPGGGRPLICSHPRTGMGYFAPPVPDMIGHIYGSGPEFDGSEHMSIFGEGDGPTILSLATPEYPARAYMMGVQGRVVLRLRLDSTGAVRDVWVLESPGFGFEEAAVDSALGSVFGPAVRDGVPVGSVVIFPLRFTINRAEG